MAQAKTILSVSEILKNSFQINKKYNFSILLTYLLWLLTCWIPYINLGTTIGLKSMIVKISKDESISAVDIFDSSHRQNIGEFLTLSFMSYYVILFSVSVFFVIPGLVMSLAWSQIYFLLIDKKIGVMESLKESYRITFGEKVEIFFARFSLILIYIVAFIVFFLLTLPAQIYLDGANREYDSFQWELRTDREQINNLSYDISRVIPNKIRSKKNEIQQIQAKLEKLPIFEEEYYYYGRYRTRTLDLTAEQSKKKKAEFADSISSLNSELDSEKLNLERATTALETTKKELQEKIDNGPSKPILDPWDYRDFRWLILAPITGFFTTLFVIAFNTSVSGYIYRRLREK